MIYLDNSATTRTLDIAADTAAQYMKADFFNPAAAYSAAVEVERNINSARARLANAIHAQSDEIIYTSGGTESNNTAIFGTLRRRADNSRRYRASVRIRSGDEHEGAVCYKRSPRG